MDPLLLYSKLFILPRNFLRHLSTSNVLSRNKTLLRLNIDQKRHSGFLNERPVHSYIKLWFIQTKHFSVNLFTKPFSLSRNSYGLELSDFINFSLLSEDLWRHCVVTEHLLN